MNRVHDQGAWFRQPVLWLAATIFAALLLACAVTIVLASRYADAPIDTETRGATAMPPRHGSSSPAANDVR